MSEGVYTKQLDPDLQQTPTRDQSQPMQGPTYVSHASCVLESRKGRHREPRPHVRKIFVEPCKRTSLGHPERSRDKEEKEEEAKMKMKGKVKAAGVSVVVDQEEEFVGASTQEVDSDDQTNAQVSEILSSTL